MSEFKVGDRVAFTSPKGTPLTGVVIEPDEWTPRSNFLIKVDPEFGYHTPLVERRAPVLAPVGPAASDPVNHPAHYTQFPVEVIELTEHLSFNLGNVVKYACRAGRKDGADPIEDLRKMVWYGERELGRLQKEVAK